ncbi:unnamed protein product [Aphanomyces euteiches]|uniref:Uncharacterized protein n=1 Tax=Aphanomyces euteiches TaxID=100861 RepID=A0A6G0XYF6_9STRA|nr:hypothetical protein Ae201684_000012 [Aphanomyces euteiches]KAH9051749.1 hypothetical protein Ae201684P_015587 [Aphanomyces euteiches]KAH9144825.1 hypothetical protein AeRB84_011239 [Aphanomyces euteiches]
MHELDVQSAWSVFLGVALGGILLVLLNYFPGEPFDYSIQNDPPAVPETNALSLKTEEEEIDRAARAVRVDKLQAMLGLEEEKIRNLVAQAKRDALARKPPTSPTNYMALADRMVYLSFFALLCYFAYHDYNINVMDIGAHYFPNEAATLRQLIRPIVGS